MATLRSRLKIPVWVVAVVVLLAAGTVMAVTITPLTFNPVEPGEGQVTNSNDLSISSSEIIYTGLTATQVNVTVSNSAGSSHTVDANLTVKNGSGTIQTSVTKTGATISSTGTTLQFNINVRVDKLGEVEILIEQTA